ncbi:VOC family protein [Kribbella sp. NPDC055071]
MGAFEQDDGVGDWRVLGRTASAWFDSPSHAAGAAFVARIAERGGALPDIDVRANGLRVRIPLDPQVARAISEIAANLGLTADPTTLQDLRLVIDAADRPSVQDFWRTALAYEPAGSAELEDPLRRDPVVSVRQFDDPRPLRNRIHVDIVRDAPAVENAREVLEREPSGPYGVRIADDEGNEIDLVPGGDLADSPGIADWRTVFSAMAFYPTTSATQASQFATAVAALADDAGLPILVDLRPSGVTVDSGKDRWENDEGEPKPEFVALATKIQAAAHSLALTAAPAGVRFVQFGIDAVDIPAVQAFWMALLGYQPDPRPELTDIYDPCRLNPTLFFQTLDPTDPRRHERSRIHLELAVPHDQAQARINSALATGGHLLSESPDRIHLADPEGNEVELLAQETQEARPST